MEYKAMLRKPELLDGLGGLLEDPEPTVVKRIIRVFANVYRHAVSSVASGDLEKATFTTAWPAVKGVAEQIINMLAGAENEGVIIHIVRFLEAALVSHLVADLSSVPEIISDGMSLVNKGIDCLVKLLTTPYVGGSSFIVATRAIITVACYKPDIREEVVALIEKQIGSPPPTLFDHNVRSLNKILQRNLFRILRRTNSVPVRGRLIEMMVTVGVPRRMLSQWAPPQEGRKRPAQLPNSDDIISGRNSPPNKKPRHENSSDEEGGVTPPVDPRESKVPRDPRLSKEFEDFESNQTPKDPRIVLQARDSLEARNSKSESPPPGHSPPPQSSSLELSHPELHSLSKEKPSSKGSSPCTSGRSTPERSSELSYKSTKPTVNSNFEFLKNLITSTKASNAAKPFLQKCSDKERALYERLDHPRVVEVVLYCLESVPESHPDDLLSQLGYSGGDVNGIREHLTRTLAPHVTEEFINSLTPPHESSSSPVTNPANLSRPSSTSSASTAFSFRSSPPPSTHRESSPPSPPSSSRSTPTDPNQVCLSDTDLRKYLDKGFSSAGDIDMRTCDPRRPVPRDPRASLGDSSNLRNSPDHVLMSSESKIGMDRDALESHGRTSETEQRVSVAQNAVMDPRMAVPDPRKPMAPVSGVDHSMPQSFSDARDPRVGMPPNHMNVEHNFNMSSSYRNMGIGPRMGMPNGSFDPNYHNKFGMHCHMNYQGPRMGNVMPNMNFGKGPMGNMPVNMNNRMGPMNNHGFVGRPGIFGPPPPPRPNLPMNNGPWQNMPMHNNGQRMFPHAPPMHL
ncbi:uncharacterized protein LOC135201678 [Macrobrachium nipponense]|uniref:uncharacterized protein LOC135201678 n=1 Tax=Macrobrachium nipponense TaxID=159736 RepID=UPI0030C88892